MIKNVKQILYTALLLQFHVLAYAGDFRLVGTNLYDFTLASKSIYRARGTISKIYPKSIEVTVPAGIGYQRYLFGDPTGLISPSDMLGMKADNVYSIERGAAVANMINSTDYYSNYFNPPPITEDQYNSLDSQMKKNYKQVLLYTKIYLLNYPCSVIKGQVIDCPAVPTKYIAFYDCGIPFIGDTNQFAHIYVVMQNRIVVRTNSAVLVPTSATNIFNAITNR
jgi:hypothetical protein